eukprot:TRINITY_DN11193_c0_g1_i3.p1 TRINITY_DN11193_c0_g1~~TRINITY_DN11193_c0_g1_i3.p1  ORF type:complete len:456 (+),score=37.70 TRINITY_DN11193_c0_g1_i3:105-1472(+)
MPRRWTLTFGRAGNKPSDNEVDAYFSDMTLEEFLRAGRLTHFEGALDEMGAETVDDLIKYRKDIIKGISVEAGRHLFKRKFDIVRKLYEEACLKGYSRQNRPASITTESNQSSTWSLEERELAGHNSTDSTLGAAPHPLSQVQDRPVLNLGEALTTASCVDDNSGQGDQLYEDPDQQNPASPRTRPLPHLPVPAAGSPVPKPRSRPRIPEPYETALDLPIHNGHESPSPFPSPQPAIYQNTASDISTSIDHEPSDYENLAADVALGATVDDYSHLLPPKLPDHLSHSRAQGTVPPIPAPHPAPSAHAAISTANSQPPSNTAPETNETEFDQQAGLGQLIDSMAIGSTELLYDNVAHTNQSWFHDISAKEAAAKLAPCAAGRFLLRPSSNASSGLTMSVRGAKNVQNLRIHKLPDGYSFFERQSSQVFPRMVDLVAFYQEHVLKIDGEIHTLTEPV